MSSDRTKQISLWMTIYIYKVLEFFLFHSFLDLLTTPVRISTLPSYPWPRTTPINPPLPPSWSIFPLFSYCIVKYDDFLFWAQLFLGWKRSAAYSKINVRNPNPLFRHLVITTVNDISANTNFTTTTIIIIIIIIVINTTIACSNIPEYKVKYRS